MLTNLSSDCWRFGMECSRPSSTVPLRSGAIGLKLACWGSRHFEHRNSKVTVIQTATTWTVR